MVQKRENIQWAAVLCIVDARGQGRMARLVRADRKTTITQITTCYNRGMQKNISEHTTRWTWRWMGYSSRRPHRMPVLSAKNRKLRLQFAQAHQKWLFYTKFCFEGIKSYRYKQNTGLLFLWVLSASIINDMFATGWSNGDPQCHFCLLYTSTHPSILTTVYFQKS